MALVVSSLNLDINWSIDSLLERFNGFFLISFLQSSHSTWNCEAKLDPIQLLDTHKSIAFFKAICGTGLINTISTPKSKYCRCNLALEGSNTTNIILF